jgi:hypothetical protein
MRRGRIIPGFRLEDSFRKECDVELLEICKGEPSVHRQTVTTTRAAVYLGTIRCGPTGQHEPVSKGRLSEQAGTPVLGFNLLCNFEDICDRRCYETRAIDTIPISARETYP